MGFRAGRDFLPVKPRSCMQLDLVVVAALLFMISLKAIERYDF
jgi:hypothetical protein